MSWHQDPTVVPYLEQRLAGPIYRGIGEVHLSGPTPARPSCGRSRSWRGGTGSSSHCHCDAEAVEILAGLVPGVRVLWAHAVFSGGPAEVERAARRRQPPA